MWFVWWYLRIGSQQKQQISMFWFRCLATYSISENNEIICTTVHIAFKFRGIPYACDSTGRPLQSSKIPHAAANIGVDTALQARVFVGKTSRPMLRCLWCILLKRGKGIGETMLS